MDATKTPPAAAAEVQLVTALVITFPLVPGVPYVSVEEAQFVPSETIIFLVVALADAGNVGVDSMKLVPLSYKTLPVPPLDEGYVAVDHAGSLDVTACKICPVLPFVNE